MPIRGARTLIAGITTFLGIVRRAIYISKKLIIKLSLIAFIFKCGINGCICDGCGGRTERVAAMGVKDGQFISKCTNLDLTTAAM